MDTTKCSSDLVDKYSVQIPVHVPFSGVDGCLIYYHKSEKV